jgi:hypothetical protein
VKTGDWQELIALTLFTKNGAVIGADMIQEKTLGLIEFKILSVRIVAYELH